MTKVVAVVWVRNSFNSLPHYRFSIRMIWGKRYIEPTLGRMDASEKWKIIWFPPHQATTLPKWIAADIQFCTQNSSEQRRPLPSLLSVSSSMGLSYVRVVSFSWHCFPYFEIYFQNSRMVSLPRDWHPYHETDFAILKVARGTWSGCCATWWTGASVYNWACCWWGVDTGQGQWGHVGGGGALTVSVDKTTRGCSTLTRQQMHKGIILFCVIALIVQCLIKGT